MTSFSEEKLIIDGEGIILSNKDDIRITPHVNTSIHQAKSKQDFYYTVSNNDGELMIICDGHGSDEVINRIRNFNFSMYTKKIKNLNPISIIKDLQNITNTPDTLGIKNGSRSSGSTISIVIATDKKIKISWLGDSVVSVFKNEELFYQTKEHNYNEDSESVDGKRIIPDYACQITEDGNMTQMPNMLFDGCFQTARPRQTTISNFAAHHSTNSTSRPTEHQLPPGM